MDDILYLVHCTNNNNYEKWNELKTSEMDVHQYPGVYFSLITKFNLNKEELYPSKYTLIFSKKLLEQRNYHINIYDYNGHINEENTYYPWNLDKAVEKIKLNQKTFMNEVIFHDPIPMKYLCASVIIYNISSEPNIKSFKHLTFLLPPYEIFNDEKPDMTKLPFYCYPYEMNYTGYCNQYPLSSIQFYIKMAKMCNININDNDNGNDNDNDNGNDNEYKINIIEKIREKMPELYKNRHLMNIDEFIS